MLAPVSRVRSTPPPRGHHWARIDANGISIVSLADFYETQGRQADRQPPPPTVFCGPLPFPPPGPYRVPHRGRGGHRAPAPARRRPRPPPPRPHPPLGRRRRGIRGRAPALLAAVSACPSPLECSVLIQGPLPAFSPRGVRASIPVHFVHFLVLCLKRSENVNSIGGGFPQVKSWCDFVPPNGTALPPPGIVIADPPPWTGSRGRRRRLSPRCPPLPLMPSPTGGGGGAPPPPRPWQRPRPPAGQGWAPGRGGGSFHSPPERPPPCPSVILPIPGPPRPATPLSGDCSQLLPQRRKPPAPPSAPRRRRHGVRVVGGLLPEGQGTPHATGVRVRSIPSVATARNPIPFNPPPFFLQTNTNPPHVTQSKGFPTGPRHRPAASPGSRSPPRPSTLSPRPLPRAPPPPPLPPPQQRASRRLGRWLRRAKRAAAAT